MSYYQVGELVMRFHDVVSRPYQARSSTTFLKKCGRGESLTTTTCLKPLVGGRHATCKIHLLQQILFSVPVKFNGDHKTAHNDEAKSGHPQCWGYNGI